MFIKIVRANETDTPDLYEADEMHLHQSSDPSCLVVEMKQGGRERLADIDKRDTVIWVMNGEGQTVDRYMWNQDLTPKR